MNCKRGHGEWFQVKLVGKKKLHCCYIMAYKMKGDQGNRTIECGNLKMNEQIPTGYITLTGTGMIE